MAMTSVTPPSGDAAMLSKYDEETLLQKLVDYRQLTKQTSKEMNRLHRKLVIRRLQRKSGRRCFDLAEKARSLGVAFEGGDGKDGKDGRSGGCGRHASGGALGALDRYRTADDCACAPSPHGCLSLGGFSEGEEEEAEAAGPDPAGPDPAALAPAAPSAVAALAASWFL